MINNMEGSNLSEASVVPLNLEEPPLEDLLRKQQSVLMELLLDQSKLGVSTQELRKAYDRAKEKFLQRRFEAIMEHSYMNGNLTTNNELADRMLEQASTAEAVQKNTVFSICIRPKEVADVQEFIKSTHRYGRSKIVSKMRYCFETATDDGTMQGVHVHMLLHTCDSIPKSVVRQRLSVTYKKFGLVNIDVQSLKDEKKIKNTEEYIGKLPGEGSSKHKDDVQFRAKYELENYYTVEKDNSETQEE
jgi:hypothetical protein